jgi:hypothetical protein
VRWVRFGEHDVIGRTHDGERGAQLVAGVGDELPLARESSLEAIEHVVEGVGQLAELVAWSLHADSVCQVLPARRARGRGELMDGAQDAPSDDPARDRREDRYSGECQQE